VKGKGRSVGSASRGVPAGRTKARKTAHEAARGPRLATLTVNAHWFPDALRTAGIANFHWHDLRHTFASRLRQSGTPLGNIAELMGHKGLSMSRRYAHLSIPNLHDAVSRISTDTTTDTAQVTDMQPVFNVH
jgi:site-specific recombinase XerD